ncbi:MAG: SGNH/GDSL hydrolase family protein [Bacteroidales bacterium]|nr:SGNH/GDSL hydrolase family protein [Bacteroidales bacterium]MCF8402533.1 SGNH/GDSL hydrolase family protein [Bacteroidales bacterium]
MKKILWFLLSFIITLGIIEIYFRLAEIAMVSTTDYDPEIGRTKRGGLNYTFFNEGFSIGRFSDYGYLGPTYPPEKKNGIKRIALIGDSFVEGYQVFDRNHFRAIMEEELNKDHDSVEVLNFGRSGFDFADMYIYYERFVKKFDPDISIFFLNKNDLKCEQTDILTPRLNINNDSLFISNKEIPQSYLSTFNTTKLLTQNIVLFQLMNSCRKLISSGQLYPKIFDKFYSILYKSDIVGSNHKLAYYIDEKSFLILKNIGKDKNTRNIIVNTDPLGLQDFVIDSAYTNNLNYIDIRKILEPQMELGNDPYYWESTGKRGHWNNNSHNLIGSFLSEKILKLNSP